MSIRNNNQQFIAKKPYCKVCHDAGKSESEYTNHYVRSSPDRNGNTNVTCPTLLSTECRFCYKLGHTTKFCPVIAGRKKYEEKSARISSFKVKEQEKKEKENKNKNNSAKKSVSGFSAIYIDSDDDAEENIKTSKTVADDKKVIVDEFPALCSVKTDKPILTGYATMASKPISSKVVAEVVAKIEEKKSNTMVPPIKKEFHVKKSWADWSDSSDGEDEDDLEDDLEEFPSFINNEATYYEDCI